MPIATFVSSEIETVGAAWKRVAVEAPDGVQYTLLGPILSTTGIHTEEARILKHA